MMQDSPHIWSEVAQLHLENLDKSFLTTLGTGFLAIMYEAIDECPSSILITYRKNGKIVGFVAGSSSMGAIYKAMLHRWFRLLDAFMPVILSPRKLFKIFEVVRYTSNDITSHLPEFELLSIAVVDSSRGSGVADQLYNEFVDHCKRTRRSGFRVVVGLGLEAAHRFYRRMGAVPVGQVEVHKGEKSLVYVQLLEQQGSL